MKKSNWKTSVLGGLTIALAIGSVLKTYLATGTIPDITAVGAAVAAGWGLLAAKDADSRI
jgi:hypothetical protein